MTRAELLQIAKPILFNTEMVRAILEDRKTVTRRLVKPQPDEKHKYPLGYVTDSTDRKTVGYFGFGIDEYGGSIQYTRPPYKPDDVLYVRETWHKYIKRVGKGEECHLAEFYGYKASIANSEDADEPWKPSIHMPKEAARIFLRVTNVRVERLQDIMKDVSGPHNQVIREGCNYGCDFIAVWESTIKEQEKNTYGWDANPWVWVIEFERCSKPFNDLAED